MAERKQCPLPVIGAMISSPPPPAREACAKNMETNLGDPSSYPGLEEAIAKLTRDVSTAVLGKPYPAALTSGATESNILAALYWRERGARRIVSFPHAHYSVWKAAHILGMGRLAVGSLRELDKYLSPQDLLVLTIGTTETGQIDPIRESLEIAREKGARVHLDAAFAGLIMRWLPDPIKVKLDETIATIAVDLHKLGEAPMPLGVLIAGDHSIIEGLTYQSPYIPTGQQFGILGSRPGCVVYAALESLEYLRKNFGSLEAVATRLIEETARLARDLSPYGYEPYAPIRTPITCLVHPDMRNIIRRLDEMGTRAYRCPRLGGIRLALMPHHIYENLIPHIEQCLKDAADRGRNQ